MQILIAQNSFSVTNVAGDMQRRKAQRRKKSCLHPNTVLTEYELCLKANKGFYGTKWV